MRFEGLKVGDLARRTGLTVRALHHYDDIGLLKPSLRTESGHRLYTSGDVARLQQILSLRQIGFSLDEIQGCLDQPDFAPLVAITLHIERLASGSSDNAASASGWKRLPAVCAWRTRFAPTNSCERSRR